MKYVYENHVGGYYVSDSELNADELYCDSCCEFDTLMTEYNEDDEKSVWDAIEYLMYELVSYEGCDTISAIKIIFNLMKLEEPKTVSDYVAIVKRIHEEDDLNQVVFVFSGYYKEWNIFDGLNDEPSLWKHNSKIIIHFNQEDILDEAVKMAEEENYKWSFSEEED